MNGYIKILIIGSLALVLSACWRSKYYEAKQSIRRTQSELSRLQRDVGQAERLLGLGKKTGSAKRDSALTKAMQGRASMDQKNMLNKYGFLFDFINPEEGNRISSSNFSWDSIQQIYYVRNPNVRKLSKRFEVFGWHPYWMGSAWQSYSFDLLSTVAYFAYKVDAQTGNYTNPAQMAEWSSTAMIDSAKAHGTRVLLSVASHGLEQNETFLANQAAWNTLIDSVANLLNARKADGVDLNFEVIPFRERWTFLQFVEQVRSGLDSRMPNGKAFISLTLPAFSNREAFELKDLQQVVDLFVIMGYDYHKGRQQIGAVAPLRTPERNGLSLQNSLGYYLEQGLLPEKTVLALPYYGAQWRGRQNGEGSYDTYLDKQVTYREVMNLYGGQFTPQFDYVSMTNYHFLEFPDSTSIECWFDDANTLGKKYDLAISSGLKGVGIWALGYDNGYTELWSLLNDKFTTDSVAVVNPVAEAEGYPIRFSEFMLRYRDIFMVAYVFFIISVVLGFIIAFSDWRVRESVVGNQLYRFLLMVSFTILLVPMLHAFNWFGDGRFQLLLSFVAGAGCLLLILRIRFSYHSNRP